MLTCVGEVTLMFGVAASPNRLIMLSCFISFDGVALGGGGTAGFSWKHINKKHVSALQTSVTDAKKKSLQNYCTLQIQSHEDF